MLGWQANMADGRQELMEQYLQTKEQQKKEKRAGDFQTEREKQLRDELAALEKKMGLKDGRHDVRGGRIMKEATKVANFSGTIAELAELEVEYHQLKKEIAAERAKAVDRMDNIQETAKNSLDKTAWTKRILENDMFDATHSGSQEEDRMAMETAGFLTREEFEKKRLEIEKRQREEVDVSAKKAAEEQVAERRALKKRKREAMKERAKSKGMLSFDDDE